MFIFISLFLLSCSPENKKSINPLGFIEKINPLWTTVLLDDFNNGIGIQGRTRGINNNRVVLFNGVKNTFQTLNGLDVNTGEILWTFDEDNIRNGSFKLYETMHQNFSHTVFPADEGVYVFEIDNGNYFSFPELNASFITRFGDDYYLSKHIQNDQGEKYGCLFKGNFFDYNYFENIICPDYSFEFLNSLGFWGYLNAICSFEDKHGID